MSELQLALLNSSNFTRMAYLNFDRELDAEVVNFDVSGGETPDSFDWDGAVITGSASSVYWDEDWIETLLDWTGAALGEGVPFFGVCFGHQALAHQLGGTVEGMGEYEIGYRTVRKTADSRLLSGVEGEFVVFQGHSDTVTELPPEATLIAKNDYGVQGFSTERVFTIQGHPEYDFETAREISEEYYDTDEVDAAALQTAQESLTDENTRAAGRTKQLFDNFLGVVEELDCSTPGR